LLTVPILARALVVALFLGTVLTALNQPAAVFGTAPFERLPFALVYITPFLVVALSQILGIRRALRDAKPVPDNERFFATMFAHGIPGRALFTGLLVGTINTTVTVAAALAETGSLTSVPLPLLAQAYSLPVLFGLLSQAISYRRAAARFANVRV
jgi:hypothetical protein